MERGSVRTDTNWRSRKERRGNRGTWSEGLDESQGLSRSERDRRTGKLNDEGDGLGG